jgi:branched-chain amino acid transport system permease protein
MIQYASQIVVNGLAISAVYILVALGFTLIFGIMRVVNFAHGEFYMLGAYAVYFFAQRLHINYLSSVLLAGLVTGAVGLLAERLLMRRLAGREINGMIVALGLSICMQAGALIVMGPDEVTVGRPVAGSLALGSVFIPYDRLLVSGLVAVLLVVFYLFMIFTPLGLSMRAVAQDQAMAKLYGIRPDRVYSAAFGIATCLAGLAGALIAPIYTINPTMGTGPMMKAFVIVVLGGLGSIPGAVAGGLLLGFLESFFSTILNSTYAAIIVFSAVILGLSVRPNGLFGSNARRTT